MKKEGMRSGVHDIFLPVARGGFSGLYIEMKAPRYRKKEGHNLSENQIAFGAHVVSEGFATNTCFTWEEARDVLVLYLNHEAH